MKARKSIKVRWRANKPDLQALESSPKKQSGYRFLSLQENSMHLQSIHIIFLGKSITSLFCTLLFLNLIINFGDDFTSEFKAHLTLLKPHFIKPVPCWWTLGSFQSFATASEITMNILAMHIPLRAGYLCDKFRAMQLLSWKICAFKILMPIAKLPPNEAAPVCSPPARSVSACCLSWLGDEPVYNAVLELSFPELNPLFLCDPMTSVNVKRPLSGKLLYLSLIKKTTLQHQSCHCGQGHINVI